MSYSQSTWSNPGTWTAACDNLKTLFTMTGVSCVSDAGTGDSRIIQFTFPGSSHRLKIAYGSSTVATFVFLKADNATTMKSIMTDFAWTSTMTVHKCENAGMGFIVFSATAPFRIVWDTYNSGSSTRLMCGGAAGSTSTYGIPESSDTYLNTTTILGTAYYAYKTISGYQILIPQVMCSDTADLLMDYPLEHCYRFPNKDTIADMTPVTINGVVYFNLITGVLLKTA